MFHNILYRIDNSTDKKNNKIGYHKKKLEKEYILFVNMQIANIKHMWLPFLQYQNSCH
jgi:hypothetical protein